jgi:CHASE3 domain sensor protein
MWETWEQAKIERLEARIADLERKNWERSDRIFRWTLYAVMAVYIALVVAAVALGASHPDH